MTRSLLPRDILWRHISKTRKASYQTQILHQACFQGYIDSCKVSFQSAKFHFNTTWGGCNTSLLDTFQTLQNRAARVIANVKYENTDHAKLLKDLDWLNVRELIEFDTASLMYKIENDLAPTHMKEMFVKTSDLYTYSTRSASSGGSHPPHRKLNIAKASFSYRVHMYGINCLLKSGMLSLLKTFIIVWKLPSKKILDIVNNFFFV